MTDNKQIFELYNLMEEKRQDLDITFDEFTVLYKAFRSPVAKEVEESNNPTKSIPLHLPCRCWVDN